MNIEKARAWLKNEIYSMNCAINYRTVPDSTIAEFEDLKDIYNTCLEAFRQLEQMNHYHDRLQDWDRGMTEKLEATIAAQETLQQELAKYITAEEEGRMVVLPCRVGDTVYFRTFAKSATVDLGIQPHNVVTYRIGVVVETKEGEPTCVLPDYEFGRSVFLTRHEAEAALAKYKAMVGE